MIKKIRKKAKKPVFPHPISHRICDRVMMTLDPHGKVQLFPAQSFLSDDPIFSDVVFPQRGIQRVFESMVAVFESMVAADFVVVLDGSSKFTVVKDRFDETPRIESIR